MLCLCEVVIDLIVMSALPSFVLKWRIFDSALNYFTFLTKKIILKPFCLLLKLQKITQCYYTHGFCPFHDEETRVRFPARLIFFMSLKYGKLNSKGKLKSYKKILTKSSFLFCKKYLWHFLEGWLIRPKSIFFINLPKISQFS